MHDIIKMSADLEASARHVSKPVVLLEQYFLRIYNLANSNSK